MTKKSSPSDEIEIEELAEMIGKSVTTIRTCSSNPKYAKYIPRPHKHPNSRRLKWYRKNVLEWLALSKPVLPNEKPAQRGAPTKAERIEAERSGITVKELRQRKGSTA